MGRFPLAVVLTLRENFNFLWWRCGEWRGEVGRQGDPGEEADASPRLGLEFWRENLRGEGQPRRMMEFYILSRITKNLFIGYK